MSWETLPAIDRNVLTSLQELEELTGRRGMLTSLVAKFASEAPRRVESMAAAVHDDNAVDLAREAHALVGSAGSIGAVRVLHWAVKLDASMPTVVPEDAATILRKLDVEVTTAVATLEPMQLAA